MTGRRGVIALAVAGACSLGWLDPSALPRAAARLYAEGKFDDAATKYNQALTDQPDSALLHFNLGDAEYRRQKYEEAARAFEQVPDDAAAAYNRGNALYQLGEAAAQEKPEDALGKWAEALVAYRRAIATDPGDEDAKFNYEWVTRKIEELQRKLDEQQQNQQRQQNEEQQPGEEGQPEPDQPDQTGQEQPPPPQERQKEEDGEAEDQQQAQQPEPSRQDGQEPPQAQAGAGETEPSEGELSRDEATALLDGERNEELRPDEIIRRQLGTGEAPVQDW